MITLLLVSLLLTAASAIAPDVIRIPVLILGGLMVVIIAFSSVELTLYLLILSTLLSPQLRWGGGTQAQLAAGLVSTTASRGITLRLDDIILTLISLAWLFRMAIFKELGTVRRTPLNKPIAAYWLASVFATLVGFYAGRVGMYGFFFVTKYLEYFVLFYVIVNHIHDEESIRRYIGVMLFTCFVVSLVGIAQIPGGGRVSAPFQGQEGEPNTFGGYLVLLFSVVLGIFLLPETRRADGKGRQWVSPLSLDPWRAAFGQPMVGMLLLIGLLLTTGFASFEVALPLYGDLRLGWSLTTVGYFFAYVGILITLVQGLLVRRIVPRLGEVRAASVGFALLIMAFALLASGPGLTLLMLATMPLTLGIGLLSPSLSALLSRISPEDAQGTIMGLYQSINSLGRVIGPALGGFFFAAHHAGMHGPAVPFMAASAMLAPAMLLLLGYVAPRPPLRTRRA